MHTHGMHTHGMDGVPWEGRDAVASHAQAVLAGSYFPPPKGRLSAGREKALKRRGKRASVRKSM